MNLLIFFFAVPPSIIDARTSADIVVKEGSPVNLSCDARGSPRPKIMWKREDADLIRYNGGKQYTNLGVKVWNMKIDFNTEGTWHRVRQ